MPLKSQAVKSAGGKTGQKYSFLKTFKYVFKQTGGLYLKSLKQTILPRW